MRLRFRVVMIAAATTMLFTFPLTTRGQETKPEASSQKKEAAKPAPQKPAPKFGMPVAVKEEEKELVLGGFETQGTLSLGYRFTSIKGRKEEYDDVFNMQQGFRLMDLSMSGRAPEGSHLFADSYFFTASGLGGDPYPGGQLLVHKDKLYDLRVNYRQTYYHWNRNDDAVLPVGPSGIENGLTSNHDWSTVRRIGSANFSVNATDNLQFTFEYYRNSRNGMTQTTRSLNYEGNPLSAWGGFARANPYIVVAPLDAVSSRVTGGVHYTRNDWTFHYRVGQQSYSQSLTWNNLTSPEQSINIDDPRTANELLTSGSWSEYRSLSTPVSEFSYNGKPNSWLELRGGYNYYQYGGPDDIDASFVGDVQTSSTGPTILPYAVSLNNRSHVDQFVHDFRQGLTAKIRDWWNLNIDYRYYRVTSDGRTEFASTFNGDAVNPASADSDWRIRSHWLDVNLEFIPMPSLVIRPGIRYSNRDVKLSEDGEIDPIATVETNSVQPVISVFYRPVKIFSVRADIQSNTSVDPYTAVSARTDIGSRFIFRLQPTDKISIEDNLAIRNRTYDQTGYRNQYRTNAINVSYQFNRAFSINAGYSYESLFGRSAVTFLRGGQPLDVVWQDAFINRGWRGGLILKPTKRFGVDVTGNFLRTTGTSQISLEPPIFGPLTFPLITGTFYYDFPKFGRLSVDLQRTYYAEELVNANNFQANLLTIRWTKSIGRRDD